MTAVKATVKIQTTTKIRIMRVMKRLLGEVGGFLKLSRSVRGRLIQGGFLSMTLMKIVSGAMELMILVQPGALLG
jgi:hypothetical protein